MKRTGKNELQQVSYEPNKQLVSFGSKLIRCEICKRWVRAYDYYNFCQRGGCEFSAEVDLAEVKRSTL